MTLKEAAKRLGFEATFKGRSVELKCVDGGVIMCKSRREASVWLSGCSFGQSMHAPDCDCGRLACTFRRQQAQPDDSDETRNSLPG